MRLAFKTGLLATLLAASGAGQGRVEGRGDARRFISEKHRFSVDIPVGWGVSAALDTQVFLYAPSSERFVQDNIPQGGAVITIKSHDTVSGAARSATTPQAWARTDLGVLAAKASPNEPFQFPADSGVSRAVMCSYDEPTFSPAQQTQHSVAIFWEFKQELFAAHLNYNANDPHAPELRRVFLQAVRSIRPLGAR